MRPDIELTDDSTRHSHGLDKARRMPKLDDAAARQYNSVSFDADWINFEATVSTSPDQIAIAPGYLQKEWVENGRRYFHYKMDAPILDIYSIQSGRYCRAPRPLAERQPGDLLPAGPRVRPRHHDGEHEGDAGLLHRRTSARSSSISCASSSSRDYGTFAESFANTVPFSEAIGFVTKTSKKSDAVNLPFYVTAHETGHQWWAHQVISAYVQGATSIDETMAQYTALMVMKHHFGPESMKNVSAL